MQKLFIKKREKEKNWKNGQATKILKNNGYLGAHMKKERDE